MENLDKNSTPYKSGEYDEMFNASEMASMAVEDIIAYRNSILMEMVFFEHQKLQEWKICINFAVGNAHVA